MQILADARAVRHRRGLCLNFTPRLGREVRQIIFEHFDLIVAAWREHFGADNAE